MPPRRKEAGSLTNSKRFADEKKQQAENSIGAKAQAVADAAGTVLSRKNDNPTRQHIATATNTIASQNKVVRNPNNQASNITYSSGNIQHSTDPYGGISLPVYDFAGMVPTDLLNPQIQLQATEEQVQNGLAQYDAGKRAQQLLQAGFKYIEEVGKTKQQYHKAQSSFVKAAIEEVKVQQNVVNFDIANIDLSIVGEKRNQAEERLTQERIKTVAAQTETQQLTMKISATEGKRDAEIRRLQAQSNDIIQKYLSDSIHGVA